MCLLFSKWLIPLVIISYIWKENYRAAESDPDGSVSFTLIWGNWKHVVVFPVCLWKKCVHETWWGKNQQGVMLACSRWYVHVLKIILPVFFLNIFILLQWPSRKFIYASRVKAGRLYFVSHTSMHRFAVC